MTNNNNTTKTSVKATNDQIRQSYNIAVNRREKKAAEKREATAKEYLLDSLGDDLDVVLVDDKGRVVIDSTHSVRQGNIDWARFMADHPEYDYDSYRKPASSVITVRPGPMIEAIAETEQLDHQEE